MQGSFSCFILSSVDFFSKSTFSKKSFRNTIKVSNSLDPDQARSFVRLDLGRNCLQRLSADDASKQRLNDSTGDDYFSQCVQYASKFLLSVYRK